MKMEKISISMQKEEIKISDKSLNFLERNRIILEKGNNSSPRQV